MKISRVITVIAAAWLQASSGFAGERLTEQEVIRGTLTANPMLKAAAAKWEAVKERIPQARAWEDPMVGVDFERMGTTRFGTYSDTEWMAAQTVPIAGKNLSRGRAAEAEARATYEELRKTRLDVIAKARVAYYRLSNAQAQVAINEQNSELLGRALELGNAKLAVGKSAQADVLAMETDLQKLRLEHLELERAFSEQQTALNVLMNRPAGSPLGKPPALEFRAMPFTATSLEIRVLAQKPDIVRAEQRLKAEEARLQLARREWIPEPQLRIEARHYRGSGDTFTEYDTGIFFSVPWANPRKYSAGVREAQQMVEAMRRELESERTMALGMLRDQLRKITAAQRQFGVSRDKLLPLARKTTETLRVNYQADTASFVELLTAQRMLREAEAASSMQLTEYLSALAELDAMSGSEPGDTGSSKNVSAPTKRRKP